MRSMQMHGPMIFMGPADASMTDHHGVSVTIAHSGWCAATIGDLDIIRCKSCSAGPILASDSVNPLTRSAGDIAISIFSSRCQGCSLLRDGRVHARHDPCLSGLKAIDARFG